MKKIITAVVSILLVLAMAVGCKVSTAQAKIIANYAGLFSSVTWIAYDNPSASAIEGVKTVLDVIVQKASDIESGKTYLETIYPELVKFIDEKIPEQDRPLCKAASLTLLNGIDTLFSMHPEWKTDQDFALDLVKSYIDGAKIGLGLRADDKIMIQARSAAEARAKALEKKGWFE